MLDDQTYSHTKRERKIREVKWALLQMMVVVCGVQCSVQCPIQQIYTLLSKRSPSLCDLVRMGSLFTTCFLRDFFFCFGGGGSEGGVFIDGDLAAVTSFSPTLSGESGSGDLLSGMAWHVIFPKKIWTIVLNKMIGANKHTWKKLTFLMYFGNVSDNVWNNWPVSFSM